MRATSVNPRVLVWARERSGHSVEEVARILKRDISEVTRWESGELVPTLGQLERLAYRVYHRPLAVFFFPEPPREPPPETEFRALPQSEVSKLEPDTLYALREAKAMQLSLHEVSDGVNQADPCLFRVLHPTAAANVPDLAHRAREILDVGVRTQIKWRGTREAFGEWRDAVEQAGIFVFKRSFEQRDVSAFCLHDCEFPLIYVNNGTTFTRQIFSLFHEVGHVLFRMSGVTKVDTSYMRGLTSRDQRVEAICNSFASELLIPSEDLAERLIDFSGDDAQVRSLARRYKVSPAVVLRRLLDRGLVSQAEYDASLAEFAKDFYARTHRGKGGNYYATQATYLGRKYLGLAFSRYNSGRWSVGQLAEHLNMKARNIPRFESYLLGKAGS